MSGSRSRSPACAPGFRMPASLRAQMQHKPVNRWDGLFVLLAAAAALWIAGSTLVIIRRAWFPIPLFDGWDHWRWFVGPLKEHYTAAFLFVQHNEHRLVIPRIFFIADHLLFGGRSVSLLIEI